MANVAEMLNRVTDIELDDNERRVLRKALDAGLVKVLRKVGLIVEGRSDIRAMVAFSAEGQQALAQAQGMVELYGQLVGLIQSELDAISEERGK